MCVWHKIDPKRITIMMGLKFSNEKIQNGRHIKQWMNWIELNKAWKLFTIVFVWYKHSLTLNWSSLYSLCVFVCVKCDRCWWFQFLPVINSYLKNIQTNQVKPMYVCVCEKDREESYNCFEMIKISIILQCRIIEQWRQIFLPLFGF